MIKFEEENTKTYPYFAKNKDLDYTVLFLKPSIGFVVCTDTKEFKEYAFSDQWDESYFIPTSGLVRIQL